MVVRKFDYSGSNKNFIFKVILVIKKCIKMVLSGDTTIFIFDYSILFIYLQKLIDMLYVELVGKTVENKELWDLDDAIIALDLPFDWQPLLGMFFYYISFSTDDKDIVTDVMNKVYEGEWKFIKKEDMLDYKTELDKFFNQ